MTDTHGVIKLNSLIDGSIDRLHSFNIDNLPSFHLYQRLEGPLFKLINDELIDRLIDWFPNFFPSNSILR